MPTVTSDSIAMVHPLSGVVSIVGPLDNSGRTIHLKTGANWQLSVLRSDGIIGGRIDADPGVELRVVSGYGNSFGDLRGVTLAAPLRIASSLFVRDGLTLDGSIIHVGEPYQFTSGYGLNFLGQQTLGGNGEVRFEQFNGTPGTASLPHLHHIAIQNGGSTGVGLTIGPNVSIRTTAGDGLISGAYNFQAAPATAPIVN